VFRSEGRVELARRLREEKEHELQKAQGTATQACMAAEMLVPMAFLNPQMLIKVMPCNRGKAVAMIFWFFSLLFPSWHVSLFPICRPWFW
jgi:hypothetical protein